MTRFSTRLKAAIGVAAVATTLVAPATRADAAPNPPTCGRSITVGSVMHAEGTPAPSTISLTKFSFPVTTAVTTSHSATRCTLPAKTVSFSSAHRTTDSIDLIGVSGTLSWAAGDTSPRTITVWVRADVTVEDDEAFVVTVRSSGSIGTALASGTGVIDNDDYNKCWGYHCGQ